MSARPGSIPITVNAAPGDYVVVLRPIPRPVPVPQRWQLALKSLLRAFGFRNVGFEVVGEQQGGSNG